MAIGRLLVSNQTTTSWPVSRGSAYLWSPVDIFRGKIKSPPLMLTCTCIFVDRVIKFYQLVATDSCTVYITNVRQQLLPLPPHHSGLNHQTFFKLFHLFGFPHHHCPSSNDIACFPQSPHHWKSVLYKLGLFLL